MGEAQRRGAGCRTPTIGKYTEKGLEGAFNRREESSLLRCIWSTWTPHPFKPTWEWVQGVVRDAWINRRQLFGVYWTPLVRQPTSQDTDEGMADSFDRTGEGDEAEPHLGCEL